jgi:mannose-6-phosphate isomerase-like protein (cupin superfamily)
MKVKELTVDPGKSLSMQRHFKRNEYWVVEEGKCQVNNSELAGRQLNKHDTIEIPVGTWHQLINPYSEPCRIVEIQYGESCVEEDIERKL